MHEYNDCSLFIGMTSLPLGKEKEFISKEFVEGLFPNYRKSLQKYSSIKFHEGIELHGASLELREDLYKPKVYALFGEFDLAILALMDDFTLSSRIFHPYNGYLRLEGKNNKKEKGFNYRYQVINGIVPKTATNGDEELTDSSLVDEFRDIYDFDSDHSLISITSFKINNGILIGNGQKVIELVIDFIRAVIADGSEKDRVQGICIESFGWNEITLVCFSDTYAKIWKKLVTLREASILDIAKKCDIELEEIINNSLIKSTFIVDNKDVSLEHSHIFVNSNTNFGYDYELINDPKLVDGLAVAKDKLVNYTSSWEVKPGHLASSELIFQYGRSPKVTIGSEVLESNNTDFKTVLKSHTLVSRKDEYKHIRGFKTTPKLNFKSISKKLATVDVGHFFFNQELSQYAFHLVDFKSIQKTMTELRVSKVLRERILNMFVNYNEGIVDPVLFTFFIELKPFLGYVKVFIETAKAKGLSLSFLHSELDSIVNNFEKAFSNRFQQSYLMQSTTDFTMEYNGGIHQIVSSFDAVYKAIVKGIGVDSDYSFCFVTGFPGVDSTSYSIRLNYFHVFQPEIFAAIATHEALNFYLRRDGDYDSAKRNKNDESPKRYVRLARVLEKVENVKALIKRNLESKNYTEREWEMRLIDKLDSNFFSTIVVDYINFYLTFNQDIELFKYWQWHYFLQMPEVYKSNGDVRITAFQQFGLRMAIVCRLIDEGTTQVKAPSTQLQDLWLNYYIDLVKLADFMLDEEFNDIFVNFGLALGDEVDVIIRREKPGQRRKDRVQKIAELESGMKSKIMAGKMISFDQELEPSIFIHSIFYSYLKLIKEHNKDKNSLLMRNSITGSPEPYWKGNERARGSNSDGDFLFDSTGGIFTHNPDTRRLHMKMRTSILKTIWNFSLIQKRKLFIPLPQKNEMAEKKALS